MNIKLKTCGGESILKDECLLHDIHESYKQIIIDGIDTYGNDIMCYEMVHSDVSAEMSRLYIIQC